MLIGLTGFAGCGKDTAAGFLVRDHGFTRVALADPLRQMLYALNPIVGARGGVAVRVADLVDELGWDAAKREHQEIRALLQRLGTEAGRAVLGERVWVDLGMLRARCVNHAIITDVRYMNEAHAILDSGGEVWRITRPGVGPVNGHVSDAGLPDEVITRTILNDGSLSDLAYAVLGAVAA